ncbi:hypothetical protein Aple_032990 [Acrocarpospora pleiomorpha]|uniref:30S ribosomal protein S14 n=1 Tax=Acrocarpospora pleiomorpha TaxID=90975 RepID=A0A5M3XMM5_9ACTN|nr:hypothetical protein Aple_032990 [Acrocarpospora pleiomorpha]
MAKKSKIAANERRRIVVARYATRRAELKEVIRTGSPDEKAAAYENWAGSPATPAPPGCATSGPDARHRRLDPDLVHGLDRASAEGEADVPVLAGEPVAAVLDVGVPPAAGAPVGVRDVVAEGGLDSGELAVGRHQVLP